MSLTYRVLSIIANTVYFLLICALVALPIALLYILLLFLWG